MKNAMREKNKRERDDDESQACHMAGKKQDVEAEIF